MRWTNKTGLHRAIVAAILAEDYDRGDSDITVTELLGAPYRRRLTRRVEHSPGEFQADVADDLYSLFGRLIHSMLEKGTEAKVNSEVGSILAQITKPVTDVSAERRLYAVDQGWKWSGQYDLKYTDHKGNIVIEDHKVTSVWSYILSNTKKDWEQQLNLLAYLARRNGCRVDEIAINSYYRDWSKREAKYKSADEYPQTQYKRTVIPLWPISKQAKYLEERMRLHQEKNPPVCTPEERWSRGAKFAIHLPNRKKAAKLCDTEKEAVDWLAQQQEVAAKERQKNRILPTDDIKTKGYKKAAGLKAANQFRDYSRATVTERAGEDVRCEGYCKASTICPYYKESKNL